MPTPVRHVEISPATPTQGARVIGAFGRNFWVETQDKVIYQASRRGKKKDVTVGDWVAITTPVDDFVAISDVHPRTNCFFRSDAWRNKTLAANMDQIAIVFASRPTFNPWFIWKALLAAKSQAIDAFVIRNKVELPELAEAAQTMLEGLNRLGVPTVALSAYDEAKTRAQLLPRLMGKRTLFVGQSGMGKSTLLNALIPSAKAHTQAYSEALDLGKQTTTSARWYDASDDGWEGVIVDTPGFQEFGLSHLTIDEVVRAMPDIYPHTQACRFLDCRHEHEPDCGVKRALEAGELTPERYRFYLHMLHHLNPRP